MYFVIKSIRDERYYIDEDGELSIGLENAHKFGSKEDALKYAAHSGMAHVVKIEE